MEVTEEQIKIITFPPNRNICIDAAPGSGKTTTILMRLEYMRRNGTSLKEVCLLTYNRFLAKDMRDKLRFYGIKLSEMGFCGTVHAFCYRETRKIRDLLPWIEKYKHYQVVHPNLRYIIFDEYQDATPDIARVVGILSRGKYLTIVGDERQQIYGHKEADARLLLSLRRDYIRFPLSVSFRCNQNICALLSNLFPSYPRIKSIVNGSRPKLYRSYGNYMRNNNIIRKIVEIVNNSKGKSIAIISPVVNSDKACKFLNDIHSNIFKFCQKEFEINIGENRQDREIASPYIITSIHGVKGKEYDTVIMLNTVENNHCYRYPNIDDLTKLFVGLSRARQELHVFEHLYYGCNTLRWINNNESLFDFDKDWRGPPRFGVEIPKTIVIKGCRQFVSQLLPEEERRLFSFYTEEELIGIESGLGQHLGDPKLSGKLVEILLAIKYFRYPPPIKFKVYITSQEWRKILKEGITPEMAQRIQMVYPFPVVVCPIKDEGGFMIKSIKGEHVNYLNEQNIISSFMCGEYYKHLPNAIRLSKSLTADINEENINKIWQVLKFECLVELSLVGFIKPNLTPDEIKRVIDYINATNILTDLNIIRYHRTTRAWVKVLPESEITPVEGEIDLETPEALIEVKCTNSNSLDDAWLQVIVYNIMLAKETTFGDNGIVNKKHHYHKTLYIFNPLVGKLYRRVLIS